MKWRRLGGGGWAWRPRGTGWIGGRTVVHPPAAIRKTGHLQSQVALLTMVKG
jgi:hypothetical protein